MLRKNKNRLTITDTPLPGAGYEEVNPSDRVFEQDRHLVPSAEDTLLAPLAHAELVVRAGKVAGSRVIAGMAETLRVTDQIHQAGRASRMPKREE